MNHITSPATARLLLEARRVSDMVQEYDYLSSEIESQEKHLLFMRAKRDRVLDQLSRTISLVDRLPDPGPDGIATMDLPAVPVAPPSEMDAALREDEPSGDPERIVCDYCDGLGYDPFDLPQVACNVCGGTGKLLPEAPVPPSINLLPESERDSEEGGAEVPAPFEPAVPGAIPVTEGGADRIENVISDTATEGTLPGSDLRCPFCNVPEGETHDICCPTRGPISEESAAVLEEIVGQIESAEPGDGFTLPDPETVEPPVVRSAWTREQGQRLKAAIKAAGISIASVARDMGMRHDAVLHQWFSARMIPSTEQIDWLRQRFPEAFDTPSEPYQTAEKAPQVTPEACQIVEPVVVTPLVRTKVAPLASGTMLHGWGEDEAAVREAIDFGRAHFDRIFHVIRTGRNYSAESVDFRPTPPEEAVMRLSLHSGEWHIKVLAGGLK